MRSTPLASTILLVTLLLSPGRPTPVHAASQEEIEAKLKAFEAEIGALRRELQDAGKPAPATAPTAPTAPPAGAPPAGARQARRHPRAPRRRRPPSRAPRC